MKYFGHNGRNESGATMLEFAVTLPVFMFTIVAIMDFTQVLTVQAILDEAANRALLRATTIANFDIDPNDPANNSISSIGFKRLQLARQKSVDSGMNFIQTARLVYLEGTSEPGGRMAKLMNLAYTEDRVPGATPITGGMMVLLPGDCAQIPSIGESVCNRQSLGITDSDSRPNGEPAVLMKNHPIRALAVAQVNGYLPFWGSRLIIGEAFGYRQPIPQGPFPAFEDPELQVAVGPPADEIPPPVLGSGTEPPDVVYSCVINPLACVRFSIDFTRPSCPDPATPGPGDCTCNPDLC